MFFQKACQGSILHFMEFSASPMEHLTEEEMEINDEKIPGQEPPAFLINMPQKFRGWIIPTVSSIRLWRRSGRGLKDRALKGNSPIKTAFGRGGRGIGGMSSFYSKRALLLSRALSVSKKFDTLPGGIQYPLDTILVPDKTRIDTPGFAPRWARVVG